MVKQISGTCPGFVIEHIVPLKRGGSDEPGNMQWQSREEAERKTVSNDDGSLLREELGAWLIPAMIQPSFNS